MYSSIAKGYGGEQRLWLDGRVETRGGGRVTIRVSVRVMVRLLRRDQELRVLVEGCGQLICVSLDDG